MFKLARCSFACVAIVALFVLATEATVRAGQGSAGPSNKTSQTKKTTKKRKKAQRVVPLVIVRSAPTTQAPTPVAPGAPVVGDFGIPATSVSRATVTASQSSGGVKILPLKSPGIGPAVTATAGQLIISEFRVRGPSGANDEFIEIYNASGADHTVAASSGTGYGVAASDGTVRCSIPNGTVIPNRGHYLCTNSVAYSLGSYPAGNGTTATGDATYTTDIPDNAGIALFNNNAGGGSFVLANRIFSTKKVAGTPH